MTIDVDGDRPGVAWVAALPMSWTTVGERLVLLLLACDAFEDVSAPSLDNLTSWSGMHRSSVIEILARLCADDERRPALVRREKRSGEPLEGRRYGKERTRYRLLFSPASPVSYPDQQSGEPGQLQQTGEPGQLLNQHTGQPGQFGEPTVAQQSGNRPGNPVTPLPLPSPPSVLSADTHLGAREHEGSCPTCGRSRWVCDRAGKNAGPGRGCPPWGRELQQQAAS